MQFTIATVVALASITLAIPVERVQKRQSLDFGTCGSPNIIFQEGLDGRNEASFQAENLQDFSQGSALNINIITNFICGRLRDACDAPQETQDACEEGKAAANGQQGQAAADAFNNALGVGNGAPAVVDNNDDIVADVEVDDVPEGCVAIPAGCVAVDNQDQQEEEEEEEEEDQQQEEEEEDDQQQQEEEQQGQNPGAGSLNLDFGQCTDPTMVRLAGVNNRAADEFTFLPNNSDGFFGGQQEALNPAIIANFICDTFINKCDAGQDAIDACAGAQAQVEAANAAGIRDQSVADAFNAALGF